MFFENVSFVTNNASIGRDIYISCFDLSKQVNETLFQIELREGFYNRTNAIWGMSEGIKREDETEEVKKEMDLIPLIVIYQSETIFVDFSFDDSSAPKGCGNETFPCSSFKIGLSYLAIAYERKVYVKNRVEMKECVKMKDISAKPRSPPVSFDGSSSIERMSGNDGKLNGMFVCIDFVEFSKLKFVFPLVSSSPYPPTVLKHTLLSIFLLVHFLLLLLILPVLLFLILSLLLRMEQQI
jgi:hypothetical protein